jgi:hypothetical protein
MGFETTFELLRMNLRASDAINSSSHVSMYQSQTRLRPQLAELTGGDRQPDLR